MFCRRHNTSGRLPSLAAENDVRGPANIPNMADPNVEEATSNGIITNPALPRTDSAKVYI